MKRHSYAIYFLQQLFEKMMKIQLHGFEKIVVGFFMISVVLGCIGEDCSQNVVDNVRQDRGADQLQSVVDLSVRRNYWYFLRKSQILYTGNIPSSEHFYYFTVYQNIVGTFLSIASYHKPDGKIQIRTFIRLGQGVKTQNNQNKKVKVQPFFIEITLQNESYQIQLDERGDFVINDQVFILQPFQQSDGTQKVDMTIQETDQFIRKQYWYYIKGAELAMIEKIQMKSRSYMLLTYSHEGGVYLAVASMDIEGVINVNTFVRLGDYEQEEVQVNQFEDDVFEIIMLGGFEPMPIALG